MVPTVVEVNSAMIPLYQHVYQELTDRINGGVHAHGTMLPSEAQLRKEFGVSLITVRLPCTISHSTVS